MADKAGDDKDRDASVWVLVPLTALMIPIIAVADGNTLVLVGVGLAFLAVVASVVARSLMDHRHDLRLREIEAERRLIVEDRLRFQDANRVLDSDLAIPQLRAALDDAANSPGSAEPARAAEIGEQSAQS